MLPLALLCVLMTAAGQLVLKRAVSVPELTQLLHAGEGAAFLGRALASPAVLVGLGLYAVATLGWLIVLGRADVSYAFPLVSIGFVVTALFASIWLGESISAARATGIALIAVGVVLVART
nr:MAG: small multi-drug resistant family protein [Pseudomonadota bacterium]